MEQKDAELIQQVLQGSQEAFSLLVKKYQKGVHALAWRKIGDFHIAQEITQDAFLKAYQKLGTLKNHNLFAGWLYVIASRLCSNWFQKNHLLEQSLEITDASEVDQVSYSRYVVEKRDTEADETRREVVKELLQKLPESERTVMTLHYLGEMTIKAISEFLGVSLNTVKSRLNRGRNRLKKEEDMIRQYLGSFQLPANLTENIMREVSRITPITPTANKPVVPWVLSAASAVLIFLLMGVGTQYLFQHQKPYSLNATSEPTVEIIEALFVLDSPAKPAVRNQVGNSSIPGKSPGSGQRPDLPRIAAALVDEEDVSTPDTQWVQTKGPEGGVVNSLFTTTLGDIYAGTPTSLYKLTKDSRTWKLVNTGSVSSLSLQDWLAGGIQMTEYRDMLYLATDTEVLVSEDNGESWDSLGTHPEGAPRGLAVTDSGFYLGLIEGVYYTEDGKTWALLKDGLEAERIRAIVAVENTVFAGTDSGLYRLKAETWEQLSVGPADRREEKLTIHALAASEHRLYVAGGWEFTTQIGTQQKTILTNANWWSLYRSTDFGDTWYAIDPRKKTEDDKEKKGKISLKIPLRGANSTPVDFTYSNFKIITNKAKVMVVDPKELFYSVNAGETWTSLDLKAMSTTTNMAPPIIMLDANTFFIGSQSGVLRTADAGNSWHEFNTGLAGATVSKLFAINGQLYAIGLNEFVTSTDGGESWTPFTGDKSDRSEISSMPIFEIFDKVLYVKGMTGMAPQIHRFSSEDKKFIPIPRIPMIFEEPTPEKAKPLNNDLPAQRQQKSSKDIFDVLNDVDKQDLESGKAPKLDAVAIEEFNKEMTKAVQEEVASSLLPSLGSFAVSGETYYVEYRQKLFRWKHGTDKWINTGLVDKAESVFLTLISNPFDYSAGFSTITNMLDEMGFKIAVSGRTVYVGKRDGHLSQSFDEGDTWNEVTADLPFPVKEFNAITFAGSTVYVATDKGAAYSSDGTNWHTVTDAEGIPLVVEKFAVEGTRVYAQDEQHVYQLKENSGIWEQVTPEIPDSVLSFAVDGNMLYVGTANRGVLRFTLDE